MLIAIRLIGQGWAGSQAADDNGGGGPGPALVGEVGEARKFNSGSEAAVWLADREAVYGGLRPELVRFGPMDQLQYEPGLRESGVIAIRGEGEDGDRG